MKRVCTLSRQVDLGRREPLVPGRYQSSRGARLAGGMIALAAACALSACGLDSQTESGPVFGQQADTALHSRIEAPDLMVAGERLNVALLQRFYARHGFEPVWTSRQAQANSLVAAVSRAGDQGLDPELFHAGLLRRAATLAPMDRDLVLSDAFLSYSDALARGAVPVEQRGDDEVLTPEPIDVAAALDAAIDSPDPGALIEGLAPRTRTYAALRQALRSYRLGAVPRYRLAANHLQTIEVNLERQRWLPRSLPADRAWVNVATQQLVLFNTGRPVFSTRVVVGEDIRPHQTPEFRAAIDASFFNPPWVIPADIVTAEILPKVRRDPQYLARQHMVMLAGGEAEQLPGPEAGLGYLMFDMPNHFDVYMHDTPDRSIFNRDNRQLSHGCIRVQDPRDFAALLLQQPIGEVNQGIAAGGTTRHDLPTPMPVFVVYETAFVDTTGTLQFTPDFYHRDAAIWQRLASRPKTPDHTLQTNNRPRVVAFSSTAGGLPRAGGAG